MQGAHHGGEYVKVEFAVASTSRNPLRVAANSLVDILKSFLCNDFEKPNNVVENKHHWLNAMYLKSGTSLDC
jgi:hypothetical protein